MRFACLFSVAIFAFALSTYAQTVQSCPSGTEDMMNYFSMGYPNRLSNHMGPGNANPIYTNIVPDLGSSFATSGYMVWAKNSAGYPWDIKAFDQNYVYDRTTELSWTDPTSFKRFTTDLPMSPRCIKLGKAGPDLRIPSSATNYSTYGNCSVTSTLNLGYVLNSITAPVMMKTGGNPSAIKTRQFKYRYSCDANYANCTYMEVFSLGYQYGLYDWKYYINQGGQWVLQQESSINQFVSGSATPYLPCSTSYQ